MPPTTPEKADAVRRIRADTGMGLRQACDFYDKHGSYEAMKAEVDANTKAGTYVSVEDRIRAAIKGYYAALDRREHGGVAESKAFNEIQEILGMHWVQGESLGPKTSLTDEAEFDHFVMKFMTSRIAKLFQHAQIRSFKAFMEVSRGEFLRWPSAGLGSWNWIELAQDVYRGGLTTNDGPGTKLKKDDICLGIEFHNGQHDRCVKVLEVDTDYMTVVDWTGAEFELPTNTQRLWLMPHAVKLVHWLDVNWNYTRVINKEN